MSNLTHKNYKFYKDFFQNKFYVSSNEIQKSFLEIEPEDFLKQLRTNKKYFCNNKVEIFEHFHKTKEEYFRFKEEEKFYKYFKRFFISLPREIKEELIDYWFEKFKNWLEKYSLPNKDLERNFDFIKNPDLIYIYNEEEKFKKKYWLRFNNFHFKNRLPFHIFGFERFSSVENKKWNLVETFLENKKPIIEPINKNKEVEILYFKEKPKTNNYVQINQITEKTKSIQINNQIKWRNWELEEKIWMRQCKIKPIDVSEFSIFVEEYDFHWKTYWTWKTEYYWVFHKWKIVWVFGFADNRLLRIATRNVRIVWFLSKVLSFKENVEVSLDEQFYTWRSLEKLWYKIKSRNSAITYYLTDLWEFSSNKRFLKWNIVESYLKPWNLIFERSEEWFWNIKSDVRFSTFYWWKYFTLSEKQKQEFNQIWFEEVNKVLEKTKNWVWLTIYEIYKMALKMSNKEIEFKNKDTFLAQKYKSIYCWLFYKNKEILLEKTLDEIDKIYKTYWNFSNYIFKLLFEKKWEEHLIFKNKIMVCKKCWKNIKINRDSKGKMRWWYNPCYVCFPPNFGSSQMEREVFEYVKSLYKWKIIWNDRKVLKWFELDVYLPNENYALEFNWVYWHQEWKEIIKYQKCKEKWIDLTNIWSYDWVRKRYVIENHIKLKLWIFKKVNLNPFVEIDFELAENFLEETSLIRPNKKSKFLWTFLNDELVWVIEIYDNAIINFWTFVNLNSFIEILPKIGIVDQNEWNFFKNYEEIWKIKWEKITIYWSTYKTLWKTIRKIL